MASSQTAQKLPTGLAGVLNNPEEHRDSAYYSSKDPSSKRKLRPPYLKTFLTTIQTILLRAMVCLQSILASRAAIPHLRLSSRRLPSPMANLPNSIPRPPAP